MHTAQQTATAVQVTRWHHFFTPVDIASLVYFRIAFGAIMLWEVWRYISYGWIKRYYIEPIFHFTYYGFGWIQPWPGDGMYWHFYGLGLLALGMALGLWYRLSAALFFLGFTYVFLLDQAQYLNHFYLICLISLLLIFLPAHRAASLDVLRCPALRTDRVPAWTLWLLRAQLSIVYFYAGLAKLNGDWLRGEPMRMWMAEYTDFPLIGELFTEEWMVSLFNYGGLLLDLLLAPLLLWRRTRPYALALAVMFHLLNAQLFSIGIFPWFMIAATLLFLPPQWPRCGGLWPEKTTPPVPEAVRPTGLRRGQYLTPAVLGTYLAVQLLVPLRHYLYPGEASWTEEGHRFAWHMKLRSKSATARFFATDTVQQETWEVDPQAYLTWRQLDKMSARPDMILQFSHYLAREFRQQGHDRVEIHATVSASLNGRTPQLLIDPTVNLAAQPRTLAPATWIVPLVEPLPQRPDS